MFDWLGRRHAIYWRSVAGSLLALPVVPAALRARVLDRISTRVDSGARIYAGTKITGAGIDIGAGVFINGGCTLRAVDTLVLEDNVHLAPGVRIDTTSHDLGPSDRRAGPSTTAPVHIGRGSWVGAGALILPGVTIGAGCVIAAGAVVVEDCRPDTLYGGVPARAIRAL